MWVVQFNAFGGWSDWFRYKEPGIAAEVMAELRRMYADRSWRMIYVEEVEGE